MLLGKRPQPPVMKRTTSMSRGMAVDMSHNHGDDDGGDGIKDHHHEVMPMRHESHDHGLMVMVPDHHHSTNNNIFGSKEHEYHEPMLSMVMSPNSNNITTNINHYSQNQTGNNPPSPHRAIQTPHFLTTCGLCNCRLAPGRDIYMYRGDTAFCSLECREQRMKEDSRKEKWTKMTSNKENRRASPRATVTAAATAKASAKGEAAACT